MKTNDAFGPDMQSSPSSATSQKRGAIPEIERPASFFAKPLKAQFSGLFRAITRGLLHWTTGDWENLANDTLDALAAISLEDDTPGQAAWALVR